MHITIELLGHFQVTMDGVALKFATDHTRALLAYLVSETRSQERTLLAALLWPEQPEAAARQNLRQTLLYLKHAMRAHPRLSEVLEITPKHVRFLSEQSWVDLHHFRSLWDACASHSHPEFSTCPACISRLQQAAALYRGEFLAGLFVKHSPLFEEWAMFVREQLHRQIVDGLEILTSAAASAEDYYQMEQVARRQLALEPWHEGAHRQVMRALALRGQNTAALAHYAYCSRILVEELGVVPSPETQLLYEQIKSGGFANPDRTTTVVIETQQSEHLPIPLTTFLGRQREVTELVALVQQSSSRLITLVGPGGIGKTRLALAVAQRFVSEPSEAESLTSHRFADGVCFLSLASLTSDAALLATIAAALGIQLTGVEPQRKLLQALSDKTMLLVFDNFEHLLPSTGSAQSHRPSTALALISALLQSVAGLQILVTSRERLNLQGEQLYAVQPLSFAPQASLAAVMELEAVQLFLQSVRRLRPDFALSNATLPALLRICQLVQGMPLGLEMAAAWTEQLSLDAIAREISQSSDFLTLEWHDIPARQRSMRSIFDWSWRLLDEAEQRVLAQLAIFRGDFSYEAAAAISGAALPMFTTLVNKSLLQRTQNLAGADGLLQIRYGLHELLRQFAYEQLSRLPAEYGQVAAQHSSYYLNFVAQRAQRLARNEPKQAMVEIQSELDNVRQAWVWATQHGVAESLQQSAYSFWQFYLQTGLCSEGAQAFQQASKAHWLEAQPELVNLLRACAAHLLTVHGKTESAISLAKQVIAELEHLPHSETQAEGRALAYLAWGHALYYSGEFAAAKQLCLVAQESAQQGNKLYTHNELFHDVAVLAPLFVGAVARSIGDHQQAKQHFQESLERSQRLGKVRGEIHAQLNLAFTYWLLREDIAARQAYETILPITRQVGYPWGEGVALYELAIVLRGQGEYSLALAYWQQALPVLRKSAEPLRETYVLANLVGIHCYLGDLNQAEQLHAQLLRFRQSFQSFDGERVGLLASFRLYYTMGEGLQALAYAEQALKQAQQIGSRMYQAEILTWLGHAHANHQQVDAAKQNYIQALVLYQAIGARPQAAEAQAGLARLALAADELNEAMAQCEVLLLTLADYPLAGLDEPFLVYLTCYEILSATQDPRAAEVIQTAYNILQQYLEQIQEAELRVSFLENVKTHRQVLRYARQ